MSPSNPTTLRVRTSRVKLAIFWGIGFALTGLIALVGMEVLLRVLIAHTFTAETEAPLTPSSIPGLGYRLAPNYSRAAMRTDANGLRARPPDLQPVEYRVLLIGDSISFGSGVPYEKSFGPLLEQQLTKKLEKNTAVWNAAVPGYNTVQESILLNQVGPSVKPNLVIVGFCMNDYLDPPHLTSGGTLDATKLDTESGFSLIALAYRSRVFVFLKEKSKELEQARPEWFPVWAHYIHYVQRKPGWQRAKLALLRIKETAGALNARLLVVVFPLEQQLRIGDRAPQDDLIRFATTNGIDVLDLYPVFREHWRDGLYVNYWAQVQVIDKLHPNERGHALAASAIASAILGEPHRYLTRRTSPAPPN